MAVGLAACALPDVSAMNFRVDDRLHFQQPRNRATVRLPLDLRWSMRDFTITAPGSTPTRQNAGYFAVFLDRQPIRPGQTMRAIAGGDEFCLHTPGCPDASYLAQRQVYVSTRTSLRLTQVNPFSGHDAAERMHRIIVVVVDAAGHRIGESSWELDLRIAGLVS